MNDEKTDENLPNDGEPEPKKKKPKCCKCKKKSFLTQCSKCNQLICISHFAPNLHECDKMAKKEEDPKYYLKKQLQSAIPSKIDKI